MASGLRFRNLDASPDDPVESWPFEGVLAALERGTLPDWRRLICCIDADPWGVVARSVEDALGLDLPYGVGALFVEAIAQARTRAAENERQVVAVTIRDLVEQSGLSRAQFAERIGTSASRLSTYVSGKVMPSAAFLVRMRRVCRPDWRWCMMQHRSGQSRPTRARWRPARRRGGRAAAAPSCLPGTGRRCGSRLRRRSRRRTHDGGNSMSAPTLIAHERRRRAIARSEERRVSEKASVLAEIERLVVEVGWPSAGGHLPGPFSEDESAGGGGGARESASSAEPDISLAVIVSAIEAFPVSSPL